MEDARRVVGMMAAPALRQRRAERFGASLFTALFASPEAAHAAHLPERPPPPQAQLCIVQPRPPPPPRQLELSADDVVEEEEMEAVWVERVREACALVMERGVPPSVSSEEEKQEEEKQFDEAGEEEVTRLGVVLALLNRIAEAGRATLAVHSDGAQWVYYTLTHPNAEYRDALRPHAVRLASHLASTRRGRVAFTSTCPTEHATPRDDPENGDRKRRRRRLQRPSTDRAPTAGTEVDAVAGAAPGAAQDERGGDGDGDGDAMTRRHWPVGQALSPAANRAWMRKQKKLNPVFFSPRRRGPRMGSVDAVVAGGVARGKTVIAVHVHCPACGDAGEALEKLPPSVVAGIEDSLKNRNNDNMNKRRNKDNNNTNKHRNEDSKDNKKEFPSSSPSEEEGEEGGLDGTEVRVIGGDDPRVSLRNQRGLFATRPWEAGETVAPYAAAVMTLGEFDAAATPPRGTLYTRWRHQRYAVTTAGKVYVPVETERGRNKRVDTRENVGVDIDAVAAENEGDEEDIVDVERDADCSEGEVEEAEVKEEPLLFCALDETLSNSTRFINDPTAVDPTDVDPTVATVAAPNCQIVETVDARAGGWPQLHVVTTRRVLPGEEFCMAYGVDYWNHEKSLRRAVEDVAAAVAAADAQLLQSTHVITRSLRESH